MDKVTELLIDALRQGAEGGEQRLYRAGKLPGLFSGRNSLNAELAAQATHDGYIELVRTETKGKATVEWVKVTPKGIAFLLEQESPVKPMEELKAALDLNVAGLPQWLAQVKEA